MFYIGIRDFSHISQPYAKDNESFVTFSVCLPFIIVQAVLDLINICPNIFSPRSGQVLRSGFRCFLANCILAFLLLSVIHVLHNCCKPSVFKYPVHLF